MRSPVKKRMDLTHLALLVMKLTHAEKYMTPMARRKELLRTELLAKHQTTH